MQDKWDKLQIYIARLFRVTLLLAVFIEVYYQRWMLIFVTILILVLTFIPAIIEKRYKLNFPIEFELVIIVFIYASLFLGNLHGYYTRFWWWDIILHVSSGLALGFVGFLIMYILHSQRKLGDNPFWIAMFAFCFAVALGTLWEIFEFFLDRVLGITTVQKSLENTMFDLIVDSVGALITSFVGYFYIRGKKYQLFDRFFMKFKRENPKYFK